MPEREQQPPLTWQVDEPLYGGAFTLLPSTPEHSPANTHPIPAQPFFLPGETVALAPSQPAALLKPSLDRIAPGCAHFGLCGGCQYQHGTYAAQLRWKQTILADLLHRAGLASIPPIQTIAAEPWAYRNRIRLRLQTLDGTLRAGYSERGTNSFLPITMCPIAAPLLWRGVEAVLAAAAVESRFARWFAHVAELELFTNSTQQALELTFFLADPAVARQEAQIFPALRDYLRNALPELTGLAALPDPELSRRTRRAWDGQLWGSPGLNYTVASRQHWVSRGAFFQVNRHLVEPLVDRVLAGLPSRIGQAWDLFAGVGLFSHALAERSDRLVAVEGADPAAKDLAQGLAGLTRSARRAAGTLTAVHSPTLDFLAARQFDRDRPDSVVLDPPRAGLGTEGAALLAKIAPTTIIYVSCDPTTLARDLSILLTSGYRTPNITLIDLFPQTFHIETVVHLTRT